MTWDWLNFVSPKHFGLIIGKGGSKIENLRQKYGVRIKVDNRQNKLLIQGDPGNKLEAIHEIQEIVGYFPSGYNSTLEYIPKDRSSNQERLRERTNIADTDLFSFESPRKSGTPLSFNAWRKPNTPSIIRQKHQQHSLKQHHLNQQYSQQDYHQYQQHHHNHHHQQQHKRDDQQLNKQYFRQHQQQHLNYQQYYLNQDNRLEGTFKKKSPKEENWQPLECMNPKYFKQLIGKQGKNIKELEKRHSVQLQVKNDQLFINGKKQDIQSVIEELTDFQNSLEKKEQRIANWETVFDFSPKYFGLIIGKNGEMRRKLELSFSIQIAIYEDKVVKIEGDEKDKENFKVYLRRIMIGVDRMLGLKKIFFIGLNDTDELKLIKCDSGEPDLCKFTSLVQKQKLSYENIIGLKQEMTNVLTVVKQRTQGNDLFKCDIMLHTGKILSRDDQIVDSVTNIRERSKMARNILYRKLTGEDLNLRKIQNLPVLKKIYRCDFTILTAEPVMLLRYKVFIEKETITNQYQFITAKQAGVRESEIVTESHHGPGYFCYPEFKVARFDIIDTTNSNTLRLNIQYLSPVEGFVESLNHHVHVLEKSFLEKLEIARNDIRIDQNSNPVSVTNTDRREAIYERKEAETNQITILNTTELNVTEAIALSGLNTTTNVRALNSEINDYYCEDYISQLECNAIRDGKEIKINEKEIFFPVGEKLHDDDMPRLKFPDLPKDYFMSFLRYSARTSYKFAKNNILRISDERILINNGNPKCEDSIRPTDRVTDVFFVNENMNRILDDPQWKVDTVVEEFEKSLKFSDTILSYLY